MYAIFNMIPMNITLFYMTKLLKIFSDKEKSSELKCKVEKAVFKCIRINVASRSSST